MRNAPHKHWAPLRALRSSTPGAWRRDLVAGLTLAAIAIPEQMATARLGDFSPQIGFFAFIAGSLGFAVFGSTRRVSVGADSTITPIFAGALALLAGSAMSPHYEQLAATLALMVGLLLAGAGVFRAGWVADLLSAPVTTGFLAGVSIHILSSQAPELLGLQVEEHGVYARLATIGRRLDAVNLPSLAIGLGTLAFVVIGEKINARIPAALIALAGATLAAAHFGLEAQGVAVLGPIGGEWPSLSLPKIAIGDAPRLIELAVVISLVVMMQTAATSRSFPDAEGEAPDIDRDFVGLGAANTLSGLLGAFPVDASPPRTAIVSESGGATQWSGLVAAGVTLALAVYGGELLAQAPIAALAGVLLFVAARIFRLRMMAEIGAASPAEFALMLVTILAVTALPVEWGVAFAIMMSLIHGVWTTTRTRLIEFERLAGETVWWPESPRLAGEKLPGVLVVAFQAPLSFLNAYQFQHDLAKAMDRADDLRLVVLEASSIVEIDFTAARILGAAIESCRRDGVDFAIARLESVRAQEALERFGVLDKLGEGRLFHSVHDATRALAG